MNCENYLKLIDDLIKGELDEQTAAEASLHVFACQNCTSKFEMFEREKEMYSHYLFEIEPPIDLSAKFQTKLTAEEKPTILAASNNFLANIFAFLRLNPTLMTAALFILFLVGFALFNLQKSEQPIEKANDIQPNIQSIPAQFSANNAVIASATPKKIENTVEKSKPEIAIKPIVVKQPEVVKKIELGPKALPKIIQPNDEELQFKRIQTLEVETAKQIEKVELLLRSFRNARQIEGSEMFDVSYEQQQARKLLQNNVALRQKAEGFGNPFAEEMLSKVEPYLLDIANLDANPLPERVLEIKERVRSQNIIVSLQGF